MASLITHFFEGGTAEQYEVVLGAVHPAGCLPPGQTYQAAGPTEGGWLVVAGWDSKDVYDRLPGGSVATVRNLQGGVTPQRMPATSRRRNRQDWCQRLSERSGGVAVTFGQGVAVDLERHRGVTEASPRRHGGPAVRPRSRHRVRHRSSEWRQSGARRVGECRYRPSRQSASRSGHGVRRDRPFEVAGEDSCPRCDGDSQVSAPGFPDPQVELYGCLPEGVECQAACGVGFRVLRDELAPPHRGN